MKSLVLVPRTASPWGALLLLLLTATTTAGMTEVQILRAVGDSIAAIEYQLQKLTPDTVTTTSTAAVTSTSTAAEISTSTAAETSTSTAAETSTSTAAETTSTAAETSTSTAAETSTSTAAETSTSTAAETTSTAAETSTSTAAETSTSTAAETTSTAAETITSTAAETSTSTAAETSTSTAAVTSTSTAAEISTSTAVETITSTAAETTTSTAAETSTSTAVETSTSTAAETSTSTAAVTSTSTAAETSTSTAAETSTSTAAETSTSTTAETSTTLTTEGKAAPAPVAAVITLNKARSVKKAVARLSTPFTAQSFEVSIQSATSCSTNSEVVNIVNAVTAVSVVSDEIASGKIDEGQATTAKNAETNVTQVVASATDELKNCVRNNKEYVDQIFQLLQSAQIKVSSKLTDKQRNGTLVIIISVLGGAVVLAIIVSVSVFIVKRKKKQTDVIKKPEQEITAKSKLEDKAPMQQDPEQSGINHGIENYGFDRAPIMAPFKAINAHKPSAQGHSSIILNEGTWDPPSDQNPRHDVNRRQEQHPYDRLVSPRTEVRSPGGRFEAERQGDTRSDLRHHDNTFNRVAKSYNSDEERTRKHPTHDSKNKRDPRSYYSDDDTFRTPQSLSRQTDYKRDHLRKLSPQGRSSHHSYGGTNSTYITKSSHSKALDYRRPRDDPRPSRKTPSLRRSYHTDKVARHARGPPNEHHSPYENSIPRITLERNRARDTKDTVQRSQLRRPYGYEDLI